MFGPEKIFFSTILETVYQMITPHRYCRIPFNLLAPANDRFTRATQDAIARGCFLDLLGNAGGVLGVLLGKKDENQAGRFRQLVGDLTADVGNSSFPVVIG